MQYLRYFLFATSILLITACGRRLPDEYFDTNTDFEGETVVIEATATNEIVIPTAEASPETNAEAEVSEPEIMLVEAEADPIIEQVANADASNGEALFNAGVPCSSCHLVDSEEMLVGPGFLNLPIRAETRIADVVAERYLYTSITAPNDFIVDGFSASMPPSYPDTYSDQEILDIVAYLMTLGDYPEREPVFIEVPVEATENADSNEEVMPVIEETAEATSENEASSDAEVVYVVVTATPSANIEDTNDEADSIETVAATSDTEESSDAEETESVVVVPDPNFDLDLSGVQETINYLAEYGVANLGEELFMENLVDDMSCQSCHTDLSYVSQQENAPSYIWAAIYSAELHGDLASQYERVLSGADTAHLIAYLMSFNDVQE